MSGLVLLAFMAQMTLAATPTNLELAEAQQWVNAKFAGIVEEGAGPVGIHVLANNDPVQMNTRNGHPMRIGATEYTRGLYCHAVSRVVVYLPGPAKSFEAVVGVDSNAQTSGGRGSVCFSVASAGKERWRSPLMREGTPALAASVALDGVREFVLAVSDGGDGIACDQADWANARVLLEDGSELWLGDLPQLGLQRSPLYADTHFLL